MVLSDVEIHGVIVVEVVMAIGEEILERFGHVKTILIEEYERCYVDIMPAVDFGGTTILATAGHERGGIM